MKNEEFHKFRKFRAFSISGIFSQNLETFCHFLDISVKFRQKFINFYQKNHKLRLLHRTNVKKMKFHFFHSGKNVDDFLADAESIKKTGKKLALEGWSPLDYFEGIVHIWASVVILPYAAKNAKPIIRRLVENYLTFLCDEMVIPRGSILLEDAGSSRKHSISKFATTLMNDKLRNFDGMKNDNKINRVWWHGNIGNIFDLEPAFIKQYLSELIIRQSKPRLSNGQSEDERDKRLLQIKVYPRRMYSLRPVTVYVQSSCGNKLRDVLGRRPWNNALLPPAPAPPAAPAPRARRRLRTLHP